MKFTFAVVCGYMSSLACAETTTDLLAQLKSAAKIELIETMHKDRPGDKPNSRSYFEMQALAGLDENEHVTVPYSFIRAVADVGAIFSSDKVVELAAALEKQFLIENERKETARAEEMRAGFSHALREALTAHSAKGVDQPLIEVAKLTASRSAQMYDTEIGADFRYLIPLGQELSEFLRRWQDYLSGRLADGANPNDRVQDLAQHDFSLLMPRSEFLEAVTRGKPAPEGALTGPKNAQLADGQVEQKARAIISGIHSLDEIDSGLEKLEQLAGESKGGHPSADEYLPRIQKELRYLNRAFKDLKSGVVNSIANAATTASSGINDEDGTADLRSQLMMYGLQRIFGPENTTTLATGEIVPIYLHRVGVAARERHDWPLLGKVIDASLILRIDPLAATADRTALQYFLGGVAEEEARQYANAVVSFEAALKTGSQLMPAELIGKLLDTIHKEHPQEFDRGVQIALTAAISDPRQRDVPSRVAYPKGSKDFIAPSIPASPTAPSSPANSVKRPLPSPGSPAAGSDEAK